MKPIATSIASKLNEKFLDNISHPDHLEIAMWRHELMSVWRTGLMVHDLEWEIPFVTQGLLVRYSQTRGLWRQASCIYIMHNYLGSDRWGYALRDLRGQQ